MAKNVGRPRSQAADESILSAADMIFFRMPYQDVSMEAIAGEAGVSKATLYRRWPSKATLAVAILMRTVEKQVVADKKKPYRQLLIENLHGLRGMLMSDYADVIVSVIAEAQHNASLRALFYSRFLRPVQAFGDADLERAIANGEVQDFVDKDLVFDQMFGLFYYRLLVAHKEITDDEIETIVDAFLTIAGVEC
ncbi:putative HTH-type transcriptional regulator [BD1-7 clade bacterium]|uniref:Putative HTH-type transcriptional regulator n=1 Tax=BD1-7 clade bacterium TaxID=2029982 RepID=A0A5S9QKX5_9GAMM|nr:putative HTH-type transcriptional regulator [BD1-7 clade bacterium]CAA0120547.1 putative HTH-type transcriptional regulator [BD1-7 clade bacterium]